jgi:hypothetical protein
MIPYFSNEKIRNTNFLHKLNTSFSSEGCKQSKNYANVK